MFVETIAGPSGGRVETAGRLVSCIACSILAGCSSIMNPFSTMPPIPEDCWFLEDQTVGFSGPTTLGALGMSGQDGRWDHVRVYAWITKDRIDLWGGAELTQAVCAVTEDRAFIAENDAAVVWNEYPVINGMADPNVERED